MEIEGGKAAGKSAGLQWGHGREAMDGAAAAVRTMGSGGLQWGHGREAMDGRRRARPRDPAPASMGPWP